MQPAPDPSPSDLTMTAPPQTVAEVEHLVQRLYQPGPGKLITHINAQLQQLQLSADGWRLADELLASPDPNVRFFAALTFTVKLNHDGATLEAETAVTVLMRLLHWLVRLVRQGEGGLVCKKLCSTLTTYYVRAPVRWEKPLLQVALSMQQGDAVTAEFVDRHAEVGMTEVLPQLNALQVRVLLWFAGTLADEVGRLDMNSQKHADLHQQMEHNVKDTSAIMAWALNREATQEIASLRLEALRCFLTWVNYAQPVWPRNPEPLKYLRDLIWEACQCLLDYEIQQEALDIFRDILESYTSFFQPQHMQVLASIISNEIRPSLLQALGGQIGDALQLGQFVVAFGCANIEQVVENPTHQEGSVAIIQLLIDILRTEGYPGDDDELSIQSIEFWNTYIEYVNDVLFSRDTDAPEPEWMAHSRHITAQLVELLWKKMWTPTSEVAAGWSDAEREGFREFRLDASDLVLSLFVFLGKDMLQRLVSFTLQALEAGQWRAVEAALFCLNTLSDNVLEDPPCEEAVGEIFKSTLFRRIADFSQTVPTQCRKTAIDMLGSYSGYIEHHAEFLPNTLRFLFASLEAPGLATAAAKSIASLCSTCRNSLTGELPDFLAQYQRFLTLGTCDAYTKEKVMGAIAAIIQALTPESAKAAPLLELIKNVESEISAAERHAADGEQEMAETAGVSALESLANIGKGLQVPDDVPIHLYDDDTDPQTSAPPNFWQTADGQSVQQRIIACFSVLAIVGTCSAAIDAACQVLRAGFTETSPGPFVLPASVTVSFVQQCQLSTPQLETVLATASMLLAQHSRPETPRIDPEAAALLSATTALIAALRHPAWDPAIALNAIDLLSRLQPRYAHLLFPALDPPTLEFILAALTGTESFVKKAAAEFWSRVLKPQSLTPAPAVEQRINEIVAAYGAKFVACLVAQLSGGASRSELDGLVEPLKAVLVHQRNGQAWLQAAIVGGSEETNGASSSSSSSSPSTGLGRAERSMFLRQVLAARSDGGRLKKVVREFWAAGRGTVVSYG